MFVLSVYSRSDFHYCKGLYWKDPFANRNSAQYYSTVTASEQPTVQRPTFTGLPRLPGWTRTARENLEEALNNNNKLITSLSTLEL
jgi:hypothetical protein